MDSIAAQLLETLGILLSSAMISAINIGVSGHLLGYVLNLEGHGDDFFRVRIPLVFRIEIRGKQVVAGFASFTLSLLFVGLFLSDIASEVFIERLSSTDNQWTAALSLATGLSVGVCIVLSAIRLIWNVTATHIAAQRKTPPPSPEERVQRLIEKPAIVEEVTNVDQETVETGDDDSIMDERE